MPKEEKKLKGRITIYPDPELEKKIKVAARLQKRNVNNFILAKLGEIL